MNQAGKQAEGSGMGISWWMVLLARGGSQSRPAVAYLLAVWATHALLRMALLFRKDAYGFPFVGKAEWYIFHAVAIDWLWILKYSLPLLLILVLSGTMGRRRLGQAAFGMLVLLHSAGLLFTVADQETMRFLGMHLDLSLWTTYGNPASLKEVLNFLDSDQSIPYLPYILLGLCVPVSWLLFKAFRSRFEWSSRDSLGKATPIALILSSMVAYVFVYHIWTGGFRMIKLRPFADTVVEALRKRAPSGLAPADLAGLGTRFQRQWILEQGDGGWVFPDPSRPYLKAPLEKLCAREAASQAGLALQGGPAPLATGRCAEDRDGDGHPAATDCDDGESRAHPRGREVPGNGVDEDCDGVDSHPVNFVLIFLESHRAVNVGHLRPFGAIAGATPVLDSLANASHAWTRFACTGIPTINALLATHMSILQHPTRYISSDFTTLNNRGFPEILRDHGYGTHFFSAADPTWDGQVPWLRQWYLEITYDRTRETDDAMFQHMARWMKDSMDVSRPFMLGAITKTNHYPFNPEPGVRDVGKDATFQERMLATMEFTDASLGRFMAAIRDEAWFANTVFIIMADHGFPLSEHGSSTIGHGLYNETMWIPFVISGSHPELGPAALHEYPASQFDIGPTVLDLAGVRESNHFLGHSLVRRATGINSISYLVRGQQGTLEHGDFRIHGPLGEIPREQGPEVFNTLVDKLEKKNLLPGAQPVYDSLLPFLRDMAILNTYLIESDGLWPDSGSLVAGEGGRKTEIRPVSLGTP